MYRHNLRLSDFTSAQRSAYEFIMYDVLVSKRNKLSRATMPGAVWVVTFVAFGLRTGALSYIQSVVYAIGEKVSLFRIESLLSGQPVLWHRKPTLSRFCVGVPASEQLHRIQKATTFIWDTRKVTKSRQGPPPLDADCITATPRSDRGPRAMLQKPAHERNMYRLDRHKKADPRAPRSGNLRTVFQPPPPTTPSSNIPMMAVRRAGPSWRCLDRKLSLGISISACLLTRRTTP